MSDTVDPLNEAARLRAARILRFKGFVEFASANFAAISAGTIVTSAAVTTVLLASYLSALDRQLIWLIEYTDILKFGIVVVSICSAYAWYIHGHIEDTLRTLNEDKGKSRTFIIILTSLFIFSLGSFVYLGLQPGGHLDFYIFVHLSILVIVGQTAIFDRTSKDFGLLQRRVLFGRAVSLLLSGGILGLTLGLYVKYDSNPVDIFYKGQQASHVTLFFLSSKYAVIYGQDKMVTVIPASDIEKVIDTAGSSSQAVKPNLNPGPATVKVPDKP